MIGQDQAFKFWYNNDYLHGVFVIVGTKPDWFNPKTVIVLCLPFIQKKICLEALI